MKKKYLSLFIFIPQEIVRESFPAAKRLEEGSQMCNVWSRLPFIFRVEDAGRRFGALLQSAKLNLPVTRCWHIWLPSLCAFGADDSSQLRKTWAKKREHSGQGYDFAHIRYSSPGRGAGARQRCSLRKAIKAAAGCLSVSSIVRPTRAGTFACAAQNAPRNQKFAI
jgi:hypothetical protein